jgi:hypothetical protein
MSTAKDVREAAEAEPGFAPLAGQRTSASRTRAGREALSGMDAGGACRG